MAALLLIVSWAVITHLHHQLKESTDTMRTLAHYATDKLELKLEHLTHLVETEGPTQGRLDSIARIERELELRSLWGEGR